MQRSTAFALLLFALWIALCYVLRFQLMEHGRWVARCESGGSVVCNMRAQLGLIIHLRLLIVPALLLAALAWLLPERAARIAGWSGLWFGGAALVLYAVTPASFVTVLCALRLVRAPRHNAATSNSDTAAQPSA